MCQHDATKKTHASYRACSSKDMMPKKLALHLLLGIATIISDAFLNEFKKKKNIVGGLSKSKLPKGGTLDSCNNRIS